MKYIENIKEVSDINLNVMLSIILLLLTILLISMSLYLYKIKSMPEVKYLIPLCIVSSIYSLGYGMELLSQTIREVEFWGIIQYFGIPFTTLFWMLFSISFTKRKIHTYYYIIFSIIPTITIYMRITNHKYHLLYRSMKMVSNGYFDVLDYERGPWYYVQFLYYIFCLCFSIYVFSKRAAKIKGTMKKQAIIMLISSYMILIPLLANIVGLNPLKIDYSAFSIVIIYVGFLISIYRYNILKFLPIIKDKIFNWIQDAVIVVDMDNNLIDYNPATEQVFTGIKKEMLGQNIISVIPELTESFNTFIESADNEHEFEIKIDKPEVKEVKYYQIRVSKVMDGDFQIGRTALISDITKKVELLKQLEDLANTDELTKLFNRRAFIHNVEQEMERLKRNDETFTFVIIDVDFFKKINDSYGHLAGDMVLMELSKRSREIIKNKGFLGRFGGEEFSLFLPNIDEIEGLSLCEKLRSSYEKTPVLYEGKKIFFTASFGITSCKFIKNTIYSVKSIINQADYALYQAKSKGRNTIEIWDGVSDWDKDSSITQK